MLLVLIAVAVATILALSFLAAQRPTAVVASNIDRKAKARQIAESALKMAIDYVNQDADWRTDKASGTWMTDAALDGGTFTLTGIDALDGDFTNDTSEPVTLSVVATYQGVTHRVSARVTPSVSALPSPAQHWLLDETTGTDIIDSIGGVDGTNYSATLAQTGVAGSAIDFDGSGQHIEVTHDDALLLNEGTFAFWFNPGDTSGTQSLISKDSSGYDTGGHVTIYLDGSTLTVRVQSTSSSYTLTSSTPVSSGQWYHAALVFGSTGLKLYLNGAQVDTDAYTGGLGTTSGGVGNYEPMVFGHGTTGSGNLVKTSLSDPYHGLIDDIRIYDVGLTAEQVAQLHDEDAEATTTPTLLALYEFEPVSIAPTLAGRWRLDETGVGYAGAVHVIDNIDLSNGAYIDGYDASAGPYGGANQQLTVRVFTNTTTSSDVDIDNSTVHGDMLVGAGGDPSSVINLTNGGSITGSTSVQTVNIPIPTYDAPSGFGASAGNTTLNTGGTVVWSSDLHFDDLTISGGTTVQVSGDVRVRVSDDFRMDNANIVLDAGATLELWVGSEFDMTGGATINNDTTRPGDVQIILYGDLVSDDFTMNNATIVGSIHSADDVVLNNGSAIYGSLTNEDDLTLNDSALHLELATAPPDVGASTTPTVAEDTAPLGNDGTVSGSPISGVAGQHGTAFEFDGSGDYVEIPHDDSYLMQGGTFSVWFKADVISGQRGLFSKDSSGYDTGGHFSVWLDGSQIEVRMQSTDASNFVSSGSGSIVAGQWYHVMFAWGEEGMVLYLDGVEVDTNSYTGGLGTTSGGVGNYEPIVLGANAWRTGNLNSVGLEHYFDGTLDDLRIYNERLSADQALEIYNGAVEPSPFISEVIVADTSGYGDALDLVVQDPDSVTWSAGGLTFDSDTLAVSLAPGTKLHDAIAATGEFSVEVLLQRASPGSTASPSRIVAMSEGAGDSNFVLGQDGSSYEARVRDSATGGSGVLAPEFVSSTALGTGDTHVVLSYKDGEVSVYIDGTLDQTNTAGGVLNNWESDHFLVFGGAYGGSSFWRGTLKRVAIYDRAFNATQAENAYNGDDPGDGGSSSAGKAVWDEVD
ncbi:MAG: LamG domain-containing protein [Phycisphaeraceae bacterium]